MVEADWTLPDVWLIVGHYFGPRELATLEGVCRTLRSVVRTPSLWKSSCELWAPSIPHFQLWAEAWQRHQETKTWLGSRYSSVKRCGRGSRTSRIPPWGFCFNPDLADSSVVYPVNRRCLCLRRGGAFRSQGSPDNSPEASQESSVTAAASAASGWQAGLDSAMRPRVIHLWRRLVLQGFVKRLSGYVSPRSAVDWRRLFLEVLQPGIAAEEAAAARDCAAVFVWGRDPVVTRPMVTAGLVGGFWQHCAAPFASAIFPVNDTRLIWRVAVDELLERRVLRIHHQFILRHNPYKHFLPSDDDHHVTDADNDPQGLSGGSSSSSSSGRYLSSGFGVVLDEYDGNRTTAHIGSVTGGNHNNASNSAASASYITDETPRRRSSSSSGGSPFAWLSTASSAQNVFGRAASYLSGFSGTHNMCRNRGGTQSPQEIEKEPPSDTVLNITFKVKMGLPTFESDEPHLEFWARNCDEGPFGGFQLRLLRPPQPKTVAITGTQSNSQHEKKEPLVTLPIPVRPLETSVPEDVIASVWTDRGSEWGWNSLIDSISAFNCFIGAGGFLYFDIRWFAESAEVSACVRQGVCSYRVTGPTYTAQEWFFCHTCGLHDKNTKNEHRGCCFACAKICHAGHDVSSQGMSASFCDCGGADVL